MTIYSWLTSSQVCEKQSHRPKDTSGWSGGRECSCVSEKEPTQCAPIALLLKNKTPRRGELVRYFKSGFQSFIGKWSGVSPSFHVPLRCYCSSPITLHCIVFSVLWNGSSKGVSTSCCLSPHLFSVPVKLGNILFMFPCLPHCSFSEVCTFTLLCPYFSRKQGVGTNKKRKKMIRHSFFFFFFPFVLSEFTK